jgi:hypothetical protein
VALLGREDGEERGEGIERETLPVGEAEDLAPEFEPVARPMTADHRAIGGDDLDPQIVEREGRGRWVIRIVVRHGNAPSSGVGALYDSGSASPR